jgi:hypothetical protein
MLLRSEFFLAMFSSGFREAQVTDYLHVVSVDCSPEILEIILTYLYTEKADFGLDVAVDVLFAADLLIIERLKAKAAVVISTLGNGAIAKPQPEEGPREQKQECSDGEREEAKRELEEPIDVYEITRAAWLTRVQRLEEFAARYLAYRLEYHIETLDFEQLVLESASRIQKRQETDSIELIDDIRYYLSERFRLRFEDSGIEDMLEEEEKQNGSKQDEYVDPGTVEVSTASSKPKTPEDEGVDVSSDGAYANKQPERRLVDDSENTGPVIRTLDGGIAGDEFARDAMDYQILLNKLDRLLEKLNLDA